MIGAEDRRPVLVTGGAGFIGCNLADRLAGEGHDVIVYDALYRPGVEDNLRWLKANHGERIQPVIADIGDAECLRDAASQVKAIFHLAAQVAVTSSLESPLQDFQTNLASTISLLEIARGLPEPPPLIFASTNKVYGDLADLELHCTGEGHRPADPAFRGGVDERRPLDFHTPYGCSKGAADQYVLDYARSFGLPAAVMRMSCIYGERQMGTEDQGWVAHFLIRAIEGQPITLYGDGHQVRDILHVSDAVDAYLSLWRRIDSVSGVPFNLGGGPENAVSLRQLIDHIEQVTGRVVDLRLADWRAGDQRYFVADTARVREALGFSAKVGWRDGVERLAAWLMNERTPDVGMLAVAGSR